MQVRNGVSALICISCCLSVCEETSVLSVYCRKPALQLVIMPVLKKLINIFICSSFILKKGDTTIISVILQFLFSFTHVDQKVQTAAKIFTFFALC